VRSALLRLVLLVVAVDALFIAGYFLFHLETASQAARIGYTATWTVVTLLLVLQGLARVRALRGRAGT
jgi:hypothetical protein